LWPDLGRAGTTLRVEQEVAEETEARELPRETFVFDQDRFLTDTLQPTQFQLFEQAPLVDRFDQPRPFVAMHVDGRDDLLRQS